MLIAVAAIVAAGWYGRGRRIVRVLRSPEGRAMGGEGGLYVVATCCLYVATGRWPRKGRLMMAMRRLARLLRDLLRAG